MLRWLAPVVLCLLLTAACGDDGEGADEASEPATATESQGENEDEGATGEPADPAPLPEKPPPPPEPGSSDKDVEQMTEAELEAACFDGLQAACDRLGH